MLRNIQDCMVITLPLQWSEKYERFWGKLRSRGGGQGDMEDPIVVLGEAEVGGG